MQKENGPSVPFRATRLWDEAIRLFTNGMPSKRHRSNMKVYDNCFTGSEAVKWFLHALEMNPHFNTVITQEKTVQLLNKLYEEGIFVKAKGSSRQGSDRFKLNGIYQMGSTKPQYSARTPLSNKQIGLNNQKSENWIRKSFHKEPFASEYENILHVKKSNEGNLNNPGIYMNMPIIKQRLIFDADGDKRPGNAVKATSDSVPMRVAQHPIQHLKQYHQLQEKRDPQSQPQLSSLPETDDLWRKVFIARLQSLLKDVDVSGLLWPSAVIRCQWLEQNCCILDDCSMANFPPWVSAASNRLMMALADKSLNRSVVNSDIEADVSALEAFFTNLQTPLIPADLSAIFQRVFLHLELTASSMKEDDSQSHKSVSIFSSRNHSFGHPNEDFKCSLPPNTCYETAFTSESPVTRLVPQSSFDTLHYRPSSACSSMKRNASAPKLLESSGLESETALNQSAADRGSIFSLTTDKFSTIGGSRWQSKINSQNASIGGSLQRGKIHSGRSKINHSCGKLTVMDKTPPLPPRQLSRPPPVHRNAPPQAKGKHSRSNSGGYVNLALQDSFEGSDITNKELDIDAAMETLQKLMICSQKTPSQRTPRKDGLQSMHVRSASLSQTHNHATQSVLGMRRSQSCWSQDFSNASLSSYHTAISSSSSSLDSDSSGSNNSLNLTAGCEWGWDWGSDAEQTGVAVFQLLMLLVKPQSRAQLQILLKLMGLLPYQCPYTTLKVLDMFSSFIMQGGDEDVTSRLLGFLVRHQKEIFHSPQELVSEVQRERKAKMKAKERGAVTFCERVSLLQFEEQKLTTSQKALADLLDQIVADQKMSSKERNKKLKMFKESYPHIYSMRFPEPEMVTFKRRNKSILQLARLRSLRV